MIPAGSKSTIVLLLSARIRIVDLRNRRVTPKV